MQLFDQIFLSKRITPWKRARDLGPIFLFAVIAGVAKRKISPPYSRTNNYAHFLTVVDMAALFMALKISKNSRSVSKFPKHQRSRSLAFAIEQFLLAHVSRLARDGASWGIDRFDLEILNA